MHWNDSSHTNWLEIDSISIIIDIPAKEACGKFRWGPICCWQPGINCLFNLSQVAIATVKFLNSQKDNIFDRV